MSGRRAEDLQIAEFQGEIRAFMKDIKEDVGEIKKQTTKTNGRVTALETAAAVQAGIDAKKGSAGKLIVGVAGLLSAALGSSMAVLLAHFIH